MLKFKTTYITASTKKEMPMRIKVVKMKPKEFYNRFQKTKERDVRDEWCLRGDNKCEKFDTRPCCPPVLKLFHQFPRRKRMYLFYVEIRKKEFYKASPLVAKNQSAEFLWNGGSHKFTRIVSNRISESLSQDKESQGFRVGGCLGCQWTKKKYCKFFMPPLEGVGIDLTAVSEEVFGHKMQWFKMNEGRYIDTMVAIGGVYTDRNITKQEIKEAIKNACNRSEL